MLPTLPLVFRTPLVLLLSVLRLVGLARVLPTLISPRPLPTFSRAGVLGRPPTAGAVFSVSLSDPTYTEVLITLVEVVVVQLIARRCLSLDTGDRDVVLRAITRRW